METHMHTETAATPKTRAAARKLKIYTDHLSEILAGKDYIVSESSLRIAGDTKYQNAVAKKIAHLMDVEHVVLVGIGGSSLGVEAVYSALRHSTTKQLHVIDAIEEDTISAFEALCRSVPRKESIACVVVSKSGNTSETLINASRVIAIGTEQYGESFLTQVVCIGNDDTEFFKAAKKKKIVTIGIPEIIGGRFSVFTAVGIVPLMLLGIDVKALCAGAMSGVQSGGDAASARALALYAAAQAGVHTLNFFTFNAPLIKLGEWYRQLLAESIGKPKTVKKKPFTNQVLPIVSSSIDLHSMAQLYLGGYTGMFTYFVHTGATTYTATEGAPWIHAHIPELTVHTASEVKDAIREGVIAAYQDAKLPYAEIVLGGQTPYEIGAYMASALYEVMCLCHLSDVDAFGQPHVELYKSHTRSLLNK